MTMFRHMAALCASGIAMAVVIAPVRADVALPTPDSGGVGVNFRFDKTINLGQDCSTGQDCNVVLSFNGRLIASQYRYEATPNEGNNGVYVSVFSTRTALQLFQWDGYKDLKNCDSPLGFSRDGSLLYLGNYAGSDPDKGRHCSPCSLSAIIPTLSRPRGSNFPTVLRRR
jgi:hypothetical protein